MDISSSDLMKVDKSRTHKPFMEGKGEEGGNQDFQTISQCLDNNHAIFTSKKRYRKCYFLDDDQARSICLNETLGHELVRITDQKKCILCDNKNTKTWYQYATFETPLCRRRELPVLHYHGIMIMYPYNFGW